MTLESLLENIGRAMGRSLWLAPFLALAAGMLTSLMPCSLASVPLVIGYVGNAGKEPGKAFRLSLLFALGAAAAFTVMGTLASLMGRLAGTAARWQYLVLGALMVLMALQTWEIISVIPSTYLLSKNRKRGYAGAFLAGVLGGIFSSPCATPVLIALLALIAAKGSLAWGIILLLFYSVGHGILAVIAGTSVGFAQNIMRYERYGKIGKAAKVILGIMILCIGLYMFYLGF